MFNKLNSYSISIQETILSSIYIFETVRILRTSLRPNTRKLLSQLVAINVIIIILDITLLSCEFANLYIIETTFKGVVYSIKLKLEFAVLGQLVQFVTWTQGGSRRQSSCYGNEKMQDLAISARDSNRLTRELSLATTCVVDVVAPAPAVRPFDHIEVVIGNASIRGSDVDARLYRHYEERPVRV